MISDNNPNKFLIKESITLNLSTMSESSINLNGSYRSNVQYDLKNYLNFTDQDIKYVTLSIPYAIITNSNYIINEYNNKIVYTYAGATSTAYIPEGNYNVTTFTTYIQSFIFPTNYFTMTYSTTTNKFTITTTPTYQSLFPASTWGFQNSTCDYIFGFTGVFTTTGNTLTMPRSMNFLPVPRFLIHCNIIDSGINFTTNSTVAYTDILCSIPNVAKLNSQIVYEDASTEFYVKNYENLTNLRITITDDWGSLINFNGLSSYMVLRFNVYKYIKEKPDTFRNIIEKNSTQKYINNNDIIFDNT